MNPEGLPAVTLILPVYNEEAHLRRCLDGICGQEYPRELLEVLVVDGRSTDSSRWIAQEYGERYPFVRLLDNPARTAPAGLNVGIGSARGAFVLRVDGHTELEPDYVRTCVAYLRRTGAEGVGGLMRAVGEGYWGEVIALVHGCRFGLGGGRFHVAEREEEADTVYLGAYRREVFEQVGPFNERLVRNQDIEFNYRLRRVGGRVLLVPAIRSWYHCRSSLRGFLQQNFRNGQWNVALLKEAPGALSGRHLVPLLFVLALLAGLALSPWSGVGRALLGAIALSYGALGGAFAVNLARRHGWGYLPGLLATFPSLHGAYGLGYLAGFLRFGVPRALLRPSTLAGLLASRRVP